MSNNTAEKIIESMYQLITEVGYEKASINMICKNVGVTKSSFYHFFESKEQVLLEIVKSTHESDLLDELKKLESIQSKKLYKQSLHDMVSEFIDSYHNNEQERKLNAEIELLTERIPEIKEVLDKSNKAILDFLRQYLQHGVDLEAFPPHFSVEDQAEMIFTVFLGLDTAILYDIPINVAKVMANTIESMFR